MQVGHDGGDGSSLTRGRLGAPGFAWQILDHVLVDTVVCVKRSQQGLR
jgi:hypothetical protein